jgi:hypothetical protein
MNIRKVITIPRLAGLALAVALPFVGTGSAQAYQCKATIVHAEAHANLRIKARSAAVQIWSDAAKSKYGLPWSVWKIAASKSMTCSWTGNQHWCIAEAKPCLYVVP